MSNVYMFFIRQTRSKGFTVYIKLEINHNWVSEKMLQNNNDNDKTTKFVQTKQW